MTTAAITMVKDESDIIETTVLHMLTQVDWVLIADNMSTDGTDQIIARIAEKHPSQVRWIVDETVGYYQSDKMTALAFDADTYWQPDWIVPFDADEIWYSPFHATISEHLDHVADQWLVMPATVYDHVATKKDDLDEDDPVLRLGYRRCEPLPLNKVACRMADGLRIHQGNHGASYPGGATIHEPQLVVRHFPYRSVKQLVRKVRNGAAAYAATDLPDNMGAHWRQWGQLLDQSGEPAIDALFHEWYYDRYPNRVDTDLIYDPAPIEG